MGIISHKLENLIFKIVVLKVAQITFLIQVSINNSVFIFKLFNLVIFFINFTAIQVITSNNIFNILILTTLDI